MGWLVAVRDPEDPRCGRPLLGARTSGAPETGRVRRVAETDLRRQRPAERRRLRHDAAEEAAVLLSAGVLQHRRQAPGDHGPARGRRAAPARQGTGARAQTARGPAGGDRRGRRRVRRGGDERADRRTPAAAATDRRGEEAPWRAARLGGGGEEAAGREVRRDARLARPDRPPGRGVERRQRRAGHHLHRVPRHPELAAGSAHPRGLPGQADRLPLRRNGRRRAGQDPQGLPRLPGSRPDADPARHRCGQRGHQPAGPLPPAAALGDPVEPQPAGAAQRPDRPARPAGTAGGHLPFRPVGLAGRSGRLA